MPLTFQIELQVKKTTNEKQEAYTQKDINIVKDWIEDSLATTINNLLSTDFPFELSVNRVDFVAAVPNFNEVHINLAQLRAEIAVLMTKQSEITVTDILIVLRNLYRKERDASI